MKKLYLLLLSGFLCADYYYPMREDLYDQLKLFVLAFSDDHEDASIANDLYAELKALRPVGNRGLEAQVSELIEEFNQTDKTLEKAILSRAWDTFCTSVQFVKPNFNCTPMHSPSPGATFTYSPAKNYKIIDRSRLQEVGGAEGQPQLHNKEQIVYIIRPNTFAQKLNVIDLKFQKIKESDLKQYVESYLGPLLAIQNVASFVPIYFGITNHSHLDGNGYVNAIDIRYGEHYRKMTIGKEKLYTEMKRWERYGIQFHMSSIFINVHPSQLKAIETYLIKHFSSHMGAGLNTNLSDRKYLEKLNPQLAADTETSDKPPKKKRKIESKPTKSIASSPMDKIKRKLFDKN